MSISTPKYRLHKGSGQALVQLDGRRIYLGKYGSDASKEKYRRLVAEWLTGHGQRPRKPEASSDHRSGLTINELILAYWRFAESYYVKGGRCTDECACIKSALKRLRALYGRTPASEFGSLALKAVRQRMIDEGLSRKYINKSVGRIRRCFRWAVENEQVDESVYLRLTTVAGLASGRGLARETHPVLPVDDQVVDQTLKHLDPVTTDLVQFQRLTGCRPGEACRSRPSDVNRSGDVWIYSPESHKMEHKDRGRHIFIGPRAQSILQRYLLRDAEAYCFVPPRSRVGRYTKDRYRDLIHRACDVAFPPPAPLARLENETLKAWRGRLTTNEFAELDKWQAEHRWNPNQLRHSAGTQIRKRYGVEGAQVALGHAQADVTQVYAERDYDLARRIMRDVG